MDSTPVEHRYAEVGGLRLHYVESGAGPLVVLLHGFPEFWYAWRHQIPALAAAGFHVVAPDMRGYNLSAKPEGVSAYDQDLLATDIAQLIRACRAERASVVGHDWGGAVAWRFAMSYPEMVDRLIILNSPHPVRFARALRTARQLRRSWYMFFFQLPWLPEAYLRSGGFAFLRRTLRDDPMREGAFSDDDIARYVDALARPGALTAAVNYYRAAIRRASSRPRQKLHRIDAPVLVIWGERDHYLGRELAAPDPEWVPRARVQFLPNASHWVQSDQPEQVNTLLLDFLLQRTA
jgi:epoxide hydrolase 4